MRLPNAFTSVVPFNAYRSLLTREEPGVGMSDLTGLGFEFEESLSGYIGVGQTDYSEGSAQGENSDTLLTFEVKISISDMQRFLNISDHAAELTGNVTFESLGGTFPIQDGIFNLFTVHPATGTREMIYSFRFTAGDGNTYFLHGHKELKCDSSPLEVTKDMTLLYTTVFAGNDETAPVYAAGKLFFDPMDIPSMIATMEVTGNPTWRQKFAVVSAFLLFGAGVLKEEYLKDLNPFYETRCEKLCLAGEAAVGGGVTRQFFLAAGAHDPGYPWGDGGSFWDVMLAVSHGNDGYRRFGITKRRLDGMQIDVQRGIFSYHGPIFELVDGYSSSYSQMKQNESHLTDCYCDMEIRFESKEFPLQPLPFLVDEDLGLASQIRNQIDTMIRDLFPTHEPLGIQITPHTIVPSKGEVKLRNSDEEITLSVVGSKTFGEAEKSTFDNIKEPTLLYGYLCGLMPDTGTARVQIDTNALRDERQYWLKDRIDSAIGTFVSHIASKELLLAGETIRVKDLVLSSSPSEDDAPRFRKLGDPILELNNDQFPTAVFQRRITEVLDPSGTKCLAVEEDMDFMRLGSINSGRKAIVASIEHDDKFLALETALQETNFWVILDQKCTDSEKVKDDFKIVIKPNFMFAYNVADRNTYTDPELVDRLVALIRERGYHDIAIVEAQSQYGEYFNKRSVKEVAEYLHYDLTESRGYKLVDLTLDSFEERYLGPRLGNHRVPITWRDADFRISFAKNKTHPWAFYTLTLKNIYGALPLASKYKEYHVERDIYHTTIEYLTAFPVDFGLIDAYLSADGPFGIFADSEPNFTKTVIGGNDLVAVDWVGATKMGIDPMISTYMRLAVEAFGKPQIHLVGNRNPYRPWLNVPSVLSLFTNFGLDRNEYFGNLLFMVAAYMDETYFPVKADSPLLLGSREAMKPLAEAIALQAGGTRTPANVLLGRLEKMLGY
jgi:uncharacterized protein (DUF362 family)